MTSTTVPAEPICRLLSDGMFAFAHLMHVPYRGPGDGRAMLLAVLGHDGDDAAPVALAEDLIAGPLRRINSGFLLDQMPEVDPDAAAASPTAAELEAALVELRARVDGDAAARAVQAAVGQIMEQAGFSSCVTHAVAVPTARGTKGFVLLAFASTGDRYAVADSVRQTVQRLTALFRVAQAA